VKLKGKVPILFAVVMIAAMGTIGGAEAALLTNPGFETGDFTGWNTTIPYGGSASVVSSYGSYGPVEGNYFARLKTDGSGSYTTAEQEVKLVLGEILSGWAAFIAGDYMPYNDNAYVGILSGGIPIATPWSASVSTVGDYGKTPWQSWSWTASGAGIYTLEYRVANALDSEFDSYALFDAAETGSGDPPGDPVPEPGTLLLIGTGLAGLAGYGKLRRSRKK